MSKAIKTYEEWLKGQLPEAEVKRRAQMLGRVYIEPQQRYDSYVRERRYWQYWNSIPANDIRKEHD